MQRLLALHDDGHTARLAASRCHRIRTAAARQLNFPPSIAQVKTPRFHAIQYRLRPGKQRINR